MDRHDLTDAEWAVIQPLPPTKVRGVLRVDDRRVIHGILWRFRAGTPWRDVPERWDRGRRSTTASSGGGRPGSGTAFSMPCQNLTTATS